MYGRATPFALESLWGGTLPVIGTAYCIYFTLAEECL